MGEEDQQEALVNALEGEDLAVKDPFLFQFERMEDMEVFLTQCLDQQGLCVNSVCSNPHTPLRLDPE